MILFTVILLVMYLGIFLSYILFLMKTNCVIRIAVDQNVKTHTGKMFTLVFNKETSILFIMFSLFHCAVCTQYLRTLLNVTCTLIFVIFLSWISNWGCSIMSISRTLQIVHLTELYFILCATMYNIKDWL